VRHPGERPGVAAGSGCRARSARPWPAVAGPRAPAPSRSCRPSDRLSAIDSAGEVSRSFSKSARSMAMTSAARAARTDADRGESVSNASSPSASPRPNSRITAPVTSSTTSSRPARTTYMAPPGSCSRNSHCPAARWRPCDFAASCLRRSGLTSENSGVCARKSAADSARGTTGSAMSGAIMRRGRGRGGFTGSSGSVSARTTRAASVSGGAWAASTRPTSKQPSPATKRQNAPNVQAC